MRLIFLPLEAILLRPIELGWPPGIHALLLIKGLSSRLRIGVIDPRELLACSSILGGLGCTECYRFGMRYTGTLALLTGFGLAFGTSRWCWARSTALRAFVARLGLAVVDSREPRFALKPLTGSSLFWRESPTTRLLCLWLLMGPRLTISGRLALGAALLWIRFGCC